MAGLTDDDKLKDVKIMGAIVYPLFQIKLRMVASGLFPEMKYEAGRSYLLDRMPIYFEGRDESPVVLLDPAERDDYDEVIESVAISPYAKYAEKELE